MTNGLLLFSNSFLMVFQFSQWISTIFLVFFGSYGGRGWRQYVLCVVCVFCCFKIFELLLFVVIRRVGCVNVPKHVVTSCNICV